MLEHEYYLAMHPLFSLNITQKRFEMIKHLILLLCDCQTLVFMLIVNNILDEY